MSDHYCYNCEKPITAEEHTWTETEEFWGAPARRPCSELLCSECLQPDIIPVTDDYDKWEDSLSSESEAIAGRTEPYPDGDPIALKYPGKIVARWFNDYECGYADWVEEWT